MDAHSAGVANAVARPRRRLRDRIDRQSQWYWVRLLLENRAGLLSLLFLIGVASAALLAPLIAPFDPVIVRPVDRLLPPGETYRLGTDDIGRDVLSRLIYGARVSLGVGIAVTVLAAVAGTTLGLLAAYYPVLDTVIMRLLDGFMAFPGILLAIAIMASLGARATNVVIALALVTTPQVARMMRGVALVLREEVYVESARAIGLTGRRILSRHILPNAMPLLIVQSTFNIALAIIAEASLSFLGAGVPAGTPTWGNMLQQGQRLIYQAWWLAVFPGAALFLTVLAFNVLGDTLRDVLDPRSQARRM